MTQRLERDKHGDICCVTQEDFTFTEHHPILGFMVIMISLCMTRQQLNPHSGQLVSGDNQLNSHL